MSCIRYSHVSLWERQLTFPYQLSQEDEAAAGADETEVRREDQEKINRFSRLHQREMLLEEELKTKAVCLVRIKCGVQVLLSCRCDFLAFAC